MKQMIKKTPLLLSIFLFAFSCTAFTEKGTTIEQTRIETGLAATLSSASNEIVMESTIVKIVKAYQNKDEIVLNSLIDKNFGITFLFARGAYQNIYTAPKISFNNPIPEYLPYATNITTDYTVNKTVLPSYSCETESWNKPSGIYHDPKHRNKQFSTIAKKENELLEATIWSKEAIKKFEKIEHISHEVIVIGKEHTPFIFYIAFINSKWCLTAIDRFEVCSV